MCVPFSLFIFYGDIFRDCDSREIIALIIITILITEFDKQIMAQLIIRKYMIVLLINTIISVNWGRTNREPNAYTRNFTVNGK